MLDDNKYYMNKFTKSVALGDEWTADCDELDFGSLVEVVRNQYGYWVEVQEEGCGCFGGCNSCLMVSY